MADPCATDTTCAAQHRECVNDQGTATCGDYEAGYHEDGGLCVADAGCGCDDNDPDTLTVPSGADTLQSRL